MGWDDHDIDGWFGPVHMTIEHIVERDETRLLEIGSDRCEICPDYAEPAMHRLALTSHLYALLEHSIELETRHSTTAPEMYTAAMEVFNAVQKILSDGESAEQLTKAMRKDLGIGHAAELMMSGTDPVEVIKSAAASWAILRSPSYQSCVGVVQRWI